MTILAAVIVVVTLIVMTTGRQPAVLALICALFVARFGRHRHPG